MNSIAFFILSCILLVCFAEAQDHLVYTQVWSPTLCRYPPPKGARCIIPPDETSFHLHGMWPTRFDDHKKPAYCDPRNVALFHPRHRHEIDENLERRMHSKWPSLHSNDRFFWNHQWVKHGTCSSNWSRKRYINDVLGFYDAHKLFMVLMAAGILPKYEDEVPELHTREGFSSAIRNIYQPIFEEAPREANGEVAGLVIGVDCTANNQLFQFRVCKTMDSFYFRDCPYPGNCPRYFRYVKYRRDEEPEPPSLILKNIIYIGPTIAKGMKSKVGTKRPKPIGGAGSSGRVYGRGYYATTLKHQGAKHWIYFHCDGWFAMFWKGKENEDGWRLGTSELDSVSQKVSASKVLGYIHIVHTSNNPYLPLCRNKDSELKSSNTSLEDCSRSISGFSFPDEDSLTTYDGSFWTLEVFEVRIPPSIDSFMFSPNMIDDDLDSPDSTFEMIKSLIESVLDGYDYDDDYYNFDKDNHDIMVELGQHGARVAKQNFSFQPFDSNQLNLGWVPLSLSSHSCPCGKICDSDLELRRFGLGVHQSVFQQRVMPSLEVPSWKEKIDLTHNCFEYQQFSIQHPGYDCSVKGELAPGKKMSA